MNKRGVEDLLWNVMMIILILTLAAFLIYWININSSGKLIKAQVDAKQTALLIDSARPGTILTLNKSVSLGQGRVKAEHEKASFEYSFFNQNRISLDKERGIEIRIEK